MTETQKKILFALKTHGAMDMKAIAQEIGYTYTTVRENAKVLRQGGYIGDVSGGRIYAHLPRVDKRPIVNEIMHALAEHGPMTAPEIAKAIGREKTDSTRVVLRDFRDAGYGFVIYEGKLYGGYKAPRYYIGTSGDPENIPDERRKTPTMLMRIIDCVREKGSATTNEIAEALCIQKKSINEAIVKNRADVELNIAGFYIDQRVRGHGAAVLSKWCYGIKEDAEDYCEHFEYLGNLGKATKELGKVMHSIWR